MYNIYIYRYVRVPSFASGGVPPLVWSYHGGGGTPAVWFTPQCTLQSRGEGKMMMMMMMIDDDDEMCVCVLILPVCFTRPHGMCLVL